MSDGRPAGTEPTDHALQVDSLSVGYGSADVLRAVTFDVPRGSITAVVGPSGSGKTTLLRAIAGVEPVRAGRIEIGGVTVAGDGIDVPPERRRIGLVPQEGALFGHLSVAANVGFGLGPWWRRSPGRSARIDELLGIVGLSEMRRRHPSTLSGGQRQRVALARALAPRPEIIGLDEPFSALDSDLRARLRTHVRETLLAQGATGLLVTHDREEAMAMADRIVVLIDGQVRQVGPPQTVYTEPRDLETARLFGDFTTAPATASGTTADGPLGRLRLRREAVGDGVVMLRPRDLELSPVEEDSRDMWHATVTGVRARGDDVLVTAAVDGQQILVSTDPGARLARGDTVWVSQRRPLHFLPAD